MKPITLTELQHDTSFLGEYGKADNVPPREMQDIVVEAIGIVEGCENLECLREAYQDLMIAEQRIRIKRQLLGSEGRVMAQQQRQGKHND